MENLKQSILSFCKKSSVKARFSVSTAKSKSSLPKPKDAEISSKNISNPSQTTNNPEDDSLVQSVLDLLPGTDVILIKVNHPCNKSYYHLAL